VEGGSFTGDPEGCVEEDWRWASLSMGAAVKPGRGLVYRWLKDEWRWALETEHLSLGELYEGNLEGRLLYCRP